MKICVIGVGNIGMRYVQGITKKFPDAKLFLIDTPNRLHELKSLELGDVKLLTSIDDIIDPLDLCVVSTSCAPRLAIYKRCLDLKPRYVVLEKYLFNSRQQFEECLSLDRVPTFVNQWLYGSKTFDCLFKEEARTVQLEGCNWGLACNSVHWIDVFKRHMGITQLQLSDETTVSKVFPSKRAGYEEIHGELVFTDANSDKTFRLIDHGDDSFDGVQQIRVNDKAYHFDFKHITLNKKILGQFPYFSEMVGDIVNGLVNTGSCHLPALEESISQHLLIEDTLETLDRRPNIT